MAGSRASLLLPILALSTTSPGQDFLRGDANRDGKVSVSDGITIRRHLFAGAWFPACRDAADANDDGRLMLDDEIEILRRLIGPPASYWTVPLPAPYPAPGEDPTADELDCSDPVTPAEATEDAVELGSVTASPGDRVEVPILLTTSVSVEALQLVVAYDPAVVTVESKLELDGTYFDRFAGDEGFHPVNLVTMRPEEGVFTVGLLGSVAYDGYAIEPGEGIVVGKIVARVSASVEPGTVISLEPTNGEDGSGTGPNGALNELTHKGDARYLSILPRTLGAALRVEISTFARGDSNVDGKLDISDPIATLGSLFLEGTPALCPDAADANDDGRVDISDPILTLGFLFDPLPGTASTLGLCGADDTADNLARCEYDACP